MARVVARIPSGRVATYGQVAQLAGSPRAARAVGRFLATLRPDSGLPWHRVVNAAGGISGGATRRGGDARQRRLLASEGVAFDARGRIDLARFLWAARSRTRP